MAHIIINGDDFGMNESCSRAIAQAMREGLITHTSMMANGGYFEEAAALMRAYGFADRVGVHCNLTEGEPLTREIRDCAAFVTDGRFNKGYLRDPRPLNDKERQAVCRELSAQIKRLTQAGIAVTFADSHHYVHNLLTLAPIFAAACRENGIERIRLNRTFSSPGRPMITEGRVDNAYWREQGFVTCRHFGRASDVTQGDIPDDTEIMVHPDFDKDGVLIDRTGMRDGCPDGVPLIRLI